MAALRTWRIAAGGGLWGVAVLSAVIVPLFVHSAVLHRTHWFGHEADPWRAFVLHGGSTTWATLALLATAGCAAGWSLADPRRRLARGVVLGAWPGVVALVAAVPGWLWLSRLGLVEPERVLQAVLLVGSAPLLAGVIASASRVWLPMAPAAALGGGAGGAYLWWLVS